MTYKFNPAFSNYYYTDSGLAYGKSILLIATITGILSSFKILITYLVCYLTPYIAETTKITKSVRLAPLFLIFVKA